ncbi:MAG TPA: hypothetical protein VE153_37345 [Myxococcus sp.]|nr:hypothetical protein [Myxococcus sp.]
MRFKLSVLLPVALLALGSLSGCSNEDDDDDDDRPSADAGTDNPDAGNHSFPDAGTDPGVSPTAACPTGAIHCDTFDGNTGWTAGEKNAVIRAEGGRLHILTQNGHDEKRTPGVQAIAQWVRPIPQFGTQLWVRAHVFLTSLPGDLGQMGTLFAVGNFDSDFGGFELQAIKDTGFALDDWTQRPGQGWNRQGPPVPLGMSAGRWVCLEWEIRRASATATHGLTRVYVDGALAHEFNPQRADPTPDGIGMRNFNRFLIGYGFVHPQGPSGSETWMDNLAISSTARIGCL